MNKSIRIDGKILSRYNEIISNEAIRFIEEIHEKFNSKRLELLSERKKRQQNIDGGGKLDFLEETKEIRDNNWKIKKYSQRFIKKAS